MIRVAILEDNDAYRKALEILISKTDGVEVVYEASNCKSLAQSFYIIKPDVAIVDIEMPDITGIEGVKMIKEYSPSTNIFMLTVFEDEQKIFESVKAGALGYLLKNDPPDEIITAIRKIHNGESIMNGKIARKVLDYYSQTRREFDLTEYSLTKREIEILGLIIQGFSYKEIASKCFISLFTVFSHIRNIYSKLNVHSRSEISAKFR